MGFNVKNQDYTLSLPTLGSTSDYKVWNENLRNYVGALQLTYLLDYDVQEPLLGLNPLASRSNDRKLAEKSAINGVFI